MLPSRHSGGRPLRGLTMALVIGSAREARFACLEYGLAADDSRQQTPARARHRRDNAEMAGWFSRPREKRSRREQ
jgi:hypothetical protein